MFGVRPAYLPGNTIRGNSIHDNKFLGIDIGGNGVTANDIGDADNGQQNFPIIASAVPEGAGVRIIGSLDSTAVRNLRPRLLREPLLQPLPPGLPRGPEVDRGDPGHDGRIRPCRVQRPDLARDGRSRPARHLHGDRRGRQHLRVLAAAGSRLGRADRRPRGGSIIFIQGMQFENGATVTVGGVPATNVQWQTQYYLQAQAPALPPGSINSLVVTNPSGLSGTLPNGYVSLFPDVDPGSGFRQYIGGLVANGLTVGCGGPNFCPVSPVTRQQMAVFLLRGKLGLCYTPPPCTGTVFDDVQCAGNSFAPWVEALAGFNITGGCGGNNYCPTADGQPPADGRLSPQGARGLRLPASGLHERDVRRRAVLEPVRALDLRARRARHHGRMRRDQLLSDRRGAPPADGRLSREDVHPAVLKEGPLPRHRRLETDLDLSCRVTENGSCRDISPDRA